MTLITFISLFKRTKLIPFPAHTPLVPSIFLRIAPTITDVDAIVANGAKTFSAKRTATLINGAANLPNKVTRNTSD